MYVCIGGTALKSTLKKIVLLLKKKKEAKKKTKNKNKFETKENYFSIFYSSKVSWQFY